MSVIEVLCLDQVSSRDLFEDTSSLHLSDDNIKQVLDFREDIVSTDQPTGVSSAVLAGVYSLTDHSSQSSRL